MLERAKSSILPNGNLREFFLWRGGEFCVFKTGIPAGPGDRVAEFAVKCTPRRFMNHGKNVGFDFSFSNVAHFRTCGKV